MWICILLCQLLLSLEHAMSPLMLSGGNDRHTQHTLLQKWSGSGFKIRTTRADLHLRLPLQGLIQLLHDSGAPALLLSCSTPQMHTTQRGWPQTPLLWNVAGVLLVRWWEPISLIAFRKNRLPLPLLSHLQGKIVLSEGKSTTLCQCLFYFVSTDRCWQT